MSEADAELAKALQYSERRRSSRLTSKPKSIYTDSNSENDETAPSNKRGRLSKQHSPPNEDKSPKKEQVVKPKIKKEKKKASPAIKKPKLDRSCRMPILRGMISEYEHNENENENENENGVVKSGRTRVLEALRAFNTHYLKSVQEEQKRAQAINDRRAKKGEKSKGKNKEQKDGEEEKTDEKRASKRPDLKASSKMLANGTAVNRVKRLGHVPGVEVGDKYFARCEMAVVGLHSHWLSGIDYMGLEYEKVYEEYKFPLAVCVVLSGKYEDDIDLSHTVTYTGQGGHDVVGRNEQIADQKLKRGNLALANNCNCKVPVRLVRGHESELSYTKTEYTYSGLYMVTRYWSERGAKGFLVYKYQLDRLDGQKESISAQVKFVRDRGPTFTELQSLVSKDISDGLENLAVPATNIIDAEPGPPTGFTYINKLEIPSGLKIPEPVPGCNCIGDCSESEDCPCAKLNDLSEIPYVRAPNSRLTETKAIVFECGEKCKCNSCCLNRTCQQGLGCRLEVFKTVNKGWAVKSPDMILAGTPVCEYTGILRRTDDLDSDHLGNNYIFDIDCVQTSKGLDGREKRPGDISFMLNNTGESDTGPEYCIDAGSSGNVARFINHSCQPNLFVQCVLSSHRDIKLTKVMLLAANHIPPHTELTYDYGYQLDSVVGADGKVEQLACHCGAAECRKRLY